MAAGLLLLAPAAADAAKVEVTSSSGPAAEEYIDYRAENGESNNVRVLLGSKTVTISDPGAKRIVVSKSKVFGLCKASGKLRVVCPAHAVFVTVGRGNDTVSFAPGGDGSAPKITDPLDLKLEFEDDEGGISTSTYVDGGLGDDVITGSTASDLIYPGPGKDKVDGRGGFDTIRVVPDSSPDTIKGGGGVDELDYTDVKVKLAIDLTAGTARGGGDTDKVSGFERVLGGAKADKLLGSARAEALYGSFGSDTIDGRAGNDLVVADRPDISSGEPDQLKGGDGDDVIDATDDKRTPTSTVDCGAGTDRVLSGVEDLVTGCESSQYRVGSDDPFPRLGAMRIPVEPVARAPDGAPTYAVACPTAEQYGNAGCATTVTLERPPVAGSSAPPEVLGTGSASLPPGATGNVAVVLTPAGQAAIATGAAVAVRVKATLAPTSAPVTPGKVDFGWQRRPGP